MSNKSDKTTFWKFLKDNKIEIPIIQRDYAQGRPDKVYLRRNFLKDLKIALNEKSEMHLDFVYGSTNSENGNKMNPLDGQQRLTTLWLLHWYIALRAGQLEASGQIFKRFTYETRISSRDFCEKLCDYKNFDGFDSKTTSIVDFITNQTWFFSAWKQDPTIQAMLIMLGGTKDTEIEDGIEKVFAYDNKENFEDYWEYLTGDKCKIVFSYLNLPEFKLTDDLYIKMNARGKQLTSFENFKADLIGYITKQTEDESLDESLNESKRDEWKKLLDAKDGIPVKLDTNWTDIFWNPLTNNRIDEIYFAFINRFFLNELIVYKKEDGKFLLSEDDENSIDKNKLYGDEGNDTDVKYNDFDDYYFDKEKKRIPVKVFINLQKTLDAFFITFKDKLKDGIKKTENLSNAKWKNKEDDNSDSSFCFIPKYKPENQITTLTQKTRVIFYAVCKYFEQGSYDETSFKHWMRVIWNLVENEGSMIGNIRFINNELASHSHAIYEYLAESPSLEAKAAKENKEQLKEEIAKAKQILDDNRKKLREYNGTSKNSAGKVYKNWEDIIIAAEKHAFFKGAIRFLFQNGNGKVDWTSFNKKWENAQKYFDENGVKEEYKVTLTKSLVVQCDDWYEQLYEKQIFNTNASTWKFILNEKNWIIPIHNILLGNEIHPAKKNTDENIQRYITPLLKKLPYAEILEKIPDGRFKWYYERLGLYYNKSNVITFDWENWHRNKILSSLTDVSTTQQSKENKNFFWGWDIDFKYKYKNKDYYFRWRRSPDGKQLDVYLIENNDYKKRKPKLPNIKTEEASFYCFKVTPAMEKDTTLFIKKLNRLISEASKQK